MKDAPKQPSVEDFDLSSLSKEHQREFHKLLYRQECRAWLLWCLIGLGGWSFLKKELGDISWVGEIALFLVVAVYTFYLSMWVISPTQKLLTRFRSEYNEEQGQNPEGAFDDSWNSAKDFVFPLLIPVVMYLTFLLLKAFGAM